jgi:hypothetical protein
LLFNYLFPLFSEAAAGPIIAIVVIILVVIAVIAVAVIARSQGLFCFAGKSSCHIFSTMPISVADPGCFIPNPDPTIPDPGGKKAPYPGSDLFLYKGY